MDRTARNLTIAIVAVGLLLLDTGRATAQTYVVSPPSVSYYYAPPAVTYYSPSVSYYYGAPASNYAPSVSYYAPPSVSYYAPTVTYYGPSVSYYAGPAAVTTTRYGLFGRPRVSTTYYPSVYVGR
jgi:hypothetical protein